MSAPPVLQSLGMRPVGEGEAELRLNTEVLRVLRETRKLANDLAVQVVVTMTTSGSPSIDADLVLVDATAGDVVVTLPSPKTWTKRTIIEKIDATTNKVGVSSLASGNILLTGQWGNVEVASDGTSYYAITSNPDGGGAGGDVTGPAGAVDASIAVYNGVTGKIIKDGGYTIAAVLDAAATTALGYANAALATAEAYTDSSIAALSATYVPLTRTLTAGAGLTGGGTLAADRTFDVVAANTTITVNADSIQVGTITNSNVTDNTLAVAKLTAGTNGQVLATVAGATAWSTPAGDVTGAPSASVVGKVNGASVPAAGALTTGNGLYVSGASALSYSALNLAGGAGWVTGSLPAANQANQTMAGDVTGTTGASTVAKINATTVTTAGGALTTGKVLRVTGAATSDWGAVDLANASAITGLLPMTNLAQNGATTGQAIIWNGSAWVPGTDFGAQNLTTTGNMLLNSSASILRLGLVNGSGAGSAASAGSIRGQDGFSLRIRNAADSGDIILLTSTSATTVVGPSTSTAGNVSMDATSTRLRLGSTDYLRCINSTVVFVQSLAAFAGGVNGTINAATNNAGAGPTLTVNGGDSSNSTSSGGTLLLRGGQGGANGTGASATLQGGNGNGTAGGAVAAVVGGNGGTSGAAAQATVTGGAGGATSGDAAGVALAGGVPVAGNGAGTTITGSAGVGTNKNGGSNIITAGAHTGSGTPGTNQLVTSNSKVMVETTYLVGARNIVALNRGVTLTSTEMPANTGNLVMYIGDAGTNPSADAVSGHIHYSDGGKPAWRFNSTNLRVDGTSSSASNHVGGLTLPALANQYLQIVINGTTFKVPCYDA